MRKRMAAADVAAAAVDKSDWSEEDRRTTIDDGEMEVGGNESDSEIEIKETDRLQMF